MKAAGAAYVNSRSMTALMRNGSVVAMIFDGRKFSQNNQNGPVEYFIAI